jgi:hypothetical protein
MRPILTCLLALGLLRPVLSQSDPCLDDRDDILCFDLMVEQIEACSTAVLDIIQYESGSAGIARLDDQIFYYYFTESILPPLGVS